MNSRISARVVAVIAAVWTLLGCSNVERSRDLANPNVSATTLTQQVCSTCHGLTGNAVSPNFPNLAGQVEPYFVAQLNGFKSHGRSDPEGFEYMWGLSRSLTDDQIKGLAAYYAAQAPMPQPIEGDAARFPEGKSLFETGDSAKGVPACAGCHGAKAEGNATMPRLAGQHVDYLVKQLIVFQRSDARPEGAVMKTIAHQLTRQNMDDVAAYLQAMPTTAGM